MPSFSIKSSIHSSKMGSPYGPSALLHRLFAITTSLTTWFSMRNHIPPMMLFDCFHQHRIEFPLSGQHSQMGMGKPKMRHLGKIQRDTQTTTLGENMTVNFGNRLDITKFFRGHVASPPRNIFPFLRWNILQSGQHFACHCRGRKSGQKARESSGIFFPEMTSCPAPRYTWRFLTVLTPKAGPPGSENESGSPFRKMPGSPTRSPWRKEPGSIAMILTGPPDEVSISRPSPLIY